MMGSLLAFVKLVYIRNLGKEPLRAMAPANLDVRRTRDVVLDCAA
jgi:hypothetical protein